MRKEYFVWFFQKREFAFPSQLLLATGVDAKLAYFTRTYVRGFVATRPFYSDIYVYHYVYICGVQRTADTSFSVLME